MDNKTVILFQNLAERLCNENDLSDVTWALCMSSPDFKKAFIEFVFDSRIIISRESKIFDFQREFGKVAGSRPDFYFILNDKEYLIEVKIYDEGHHFVQYNQAFPNAELGYITNYYMGSQNGIMVKTWEGFYNYLKKPEQFWHEDDKLLIEGYREYLKSVCNIIKFEHMKFDNLKSLYDFNLALQKVFPCNSDDYKSIYYRKMMGDNYCGAYFELKWSGKTAWGWAGIYYTTTEICIEFNNDSNYGFEVFNLLKNNEAAFNSLKNDFIIKTEFSDNKYFFILNRKKFEANEDPDLQIDFLKSFISEVFSFISKL